MLRRIQNSVAKFSILLFMPCQPSFLYHLFYKQDETIDISYSEGKQKLLYTKHKKYLKFKFYAAAATPFWFDCMRAVRLPTKCQKDYSFFFVFVYTYYQIKPIKKLIFYLACPSVATLSLLYYPPSSLSASNNANDNPFIRNSDCRNKTCCQTPLKSQLGS